MASNHPQQLTGTIVWYNKKQGFGFVAPDTEGEDIFVHHSALQDGIQTKISAGDRIRFSLEQRPKGPSAVDVSPLNGSSSQSSAKKRANKGADRVRPNPERRTKAASAIEDSPQNGTSRANAKKQAERVADRPRLRPERQQRGLSAIEVSPQNGSSLQPVLDAADDFARLNLDLKLLRALVEAGYTEPTPIQTQAIPHVLTGRDLMGCAQTGTGKTAAFALPILQHLSANQDDGWAQKGFSKRGVRALVLSPTRELAIQIGDSFNTYGRYTGLRNAVIFGGVSDKPQIQAVRNGVDILIATPGRLIDLMGQGHIRLEQVEVLVLDEADRMLDMGFIRDVQRIVRQIPTQRQTLLFSATLPKEIIALADAILHDPIHVSVTPEQPTVEAIQQSVYLVTVKQKQALLEQVLADPRVERTLVFTRTKHGANKVVKNLKRAGIEVEPIHGNRSQAARQQALQRFREGKTRVLVATDVVSRGIDIDDITHVIQYDLPSEAAVYVHRIGRTGRAGATGTAIAFCAETERPTLKAIEKLIKMKIPVVQGWE